MIKKKIKTPTALNYMLLQKRKLSTERFLTTVKEKSVISRCFLVTSYMGKQSTQYNQ